VKPGVREVCHIRMLGLKFLNVVLTEIPKAGS
jgi:hypothetical protein